MRQTQPAPDLAGHSRSGFGVLHDVLQAPHRALDAMESDGGYSLARVCCGGLLAWIAYGAAAGLFQGGTQLMVSAVKAPLVILLTMALCLPSLYVGASLGAGGFSLRRFLAAAAGFAGLLGLLLAGLLPVVWLFSVSSRSLGFLVFLHLVVWIVCSALALRVLAAAITGARGILLLWLLLFVLVSFQATTYLRPVLWRPSGEPVLTGEKMLFLEHLGQVLDADRELRRRER